MKKLMTAVALLISGVIVAQTQTQTPTQTQTTTTTQSTTAKDQFKAKYPNATEVYWKNEKDNMRVNYTENNSKHAIVYDKNGNIVSEETEVQSSAVPATINEYYKKKGVDNTKGTTYTVWETKDKDGNVTYYSDYNGKTSYFDKNGNMTTRQGVAVGDEKEPMEKDMPKDK